MPDAATVITALQQQMPAVLRWSGAVAKRLRTFDIALDGKSSGSSNTDALTLADLIVQELVVAALRDADPVLRDCRIQAEETTGDLAAFASESELTLALDPIDGTKAFRDRTGPGYCVMLHLRNETDVLYSLVYLPEEGPQGSWVEVNGNRTSGTIKCGPDDPSRPAETVLEDMSPVEPAERGDSPRFYLIGFQDADPDRAADVTSVGLDGVPPDEMPGSVYPLFASGAFGGSLIHSPNIYDFPVSLHIARVLGGDAVWAHSGEPVHFRELWLDERADMLRLPGIVACAINREKLRTLVDLAAGWSRQRYASPA